MRRPVGLPISMHWRHKALSPGKVMPRRRFARLLAPACLALALFAGELGLSAWAYLVAHALSFERASLGRRCAGLWPYAAVTLLWACAYRASGAGISGSGVYLHPLTDPVAFASALPARAGLLLGAAFGPLERLDETLDLRYVDISPVGEDLRIVARPRGT